jgi:hypothetical protein
MDMCSCSMNMGGSGSMGMQHSGMDMGDSGMIMQVGGMGMGGGGIPFSVASFCWFCMSYFDQNKQVQAIDKSTKRTFVG